MSIATYRGVSYDTTQIKDQSSKSVQCVYRGIRYTSTQNKEASKNA